MSSNKVVALKEIWFFSPGVKGDKREAHLEFNMVYIAKKNISSIVDTIKRNHIGIPYEQRELLSTTYLFGADKYCDIAQKLITAK